MKLKEFSLLLIFLIGMTVFIISVETKRKQTSKSTNFVVHFLKALGIRTRTRGLARLINKRCTRFIKSKIVYNLSRRIHKLSKGLKKLKKFKMNEEFCKKSEKGDLEYPCCSVCLAEISKNQDTTLIPCGHMYHDSCILKWLDMHNSCPVCRYELPTDNADYERQRNSSQSNTTFNNTTNSVRF